MGFLAFIATAAPLPNPDTDAHDVGDIKDEKRNSDAILYKREPSHESLQTASYVVRSLCTPEDENCDEGSYSDELEKHGGGRKARPSTRKRPAKKRPTKKKPVKKPTTKTPATKKPNTGIRPGTGTGGKKGGKKTPVKAQPGKSKDYLVVEAAAKKKGKKLVVGRSYLLTEMSHAVISHHKLIVAKVIRKGKGKNKQLDVEATMQQLVLKEGERGTCFEFLGGTCTNVPLKEYSCSKRVESGKGAFKFSGTAKPEFGDPDHFIVQGKSDAVGGLV